MSEGDSSKVPDPIGEVFISYSWDSTDHVHSVLQLSNRLRVEGVDALIDQYEVSPPEGWPMWMDRHIKSAAFVLVVCTENYYKKVMGEEKVDLGSGVKWEGGLVYQHLYNAGSRNTKFVPVLLKPQDKVFIPTPLQGATFYVLDSEVGYQKLYSRLTNRPQVDKPKLGKIRSVPKREVKTDLSMYVTSPIDLELWDKAKWKATFFITGGGIPPMLGIGFLNADPARKIFEQWHKRYGDRDDYEELRVAIIEGDIPGEGSGYSVHIGADPENTVKRYRAAGLTINQNDKFMFVSRINRMNPRLDSTNLPIFKQAYRYAKGYYLIPGTCKPDGSEITPFTDLAIFKSGLHLRSVEDVGSNDIDAAIFPEKHSKKFKK